MRAQDKYRQPDHWRAYTFAQGTGCRPMAGLRKSDAEEFCSWLTARKPGLWGYSLPVRDDLRTFGESSGDRQGLQFHYEGDEKKTHFLSWHEILEHIRNDHNSTAVQAIHRLNWLMSYLALVIIDLAID